MTHSTRYRAAKAWVSVTLAAAFFLEMCAPVGVALAQQATPAVPSAPSGPMPGGTGTSGTPSGAPTPSGPATIPVPAARPTTQPQLTRPQAPPPATEVQPSGGEVLSPIETDFAESMEPSAPSAERGLRQFGYDLFRTPATTFAPVEDVPVGPDYILGPGDSLTIYVWGLVESVFTRDESTGTARSSSPGPAR